MALDSSTSVHIYPIIKSDEEIKSMINSTINDKNAQAVKVAVQQKSDQLVHYKKVLSKWKWWRNFTAYMLVSIGVTLQIASLVIGILIDINYMHNTSATEIIDSASLFLLVPAGIIAASIFDKVITKWSNVCNEITKCIDQVYVYWLQATNDNVISDDEQAKFTTIFTQTDKQVSIEENTPVLTSTTITDIESVLTQGLAFVKDIKKKSS